VDFQHKNMLIGGINLAIISGAIVRHHILLAQGDYSK
jgi:hypothetical protein